MELIDRSTLPNYALRGMMTVGDMKQPAEMRIVLWDDIKAMPTVNDVEPVRHGQWIDKGWDGDFSWQIDGRGSCWRVLECSECNCKTSTKTNYCPNCGAKMDIKS